MTGNRRRKPTGIELSVDNGTPMVAFEIAWGLERSHVVQFTMIIVWLLSKTQTCCRNGEGEISQLAVVNVVLIVGMFYT